MGVEETCQCGGDGWIRYQAPLKAPGVIGSVVPCEVCNPDGERPDPMNEPLSYDVTNTDCTRLSEGLQCVLGAGHAGVCIPFAPEPKPEGHWTVERVWFEELDLGDGDRYGHRPSIEPASDPGQRVTVLSTVVCPSGMAGQRQTVVVTLCAERWVEGSA
jgi:hypothetical protein